MAILELANYPPEESIPRSDPPPQSNFRSGQAQTGQIKLAVLRVSQEADIRHHDGANRTEPREDLSRLGEASHMSIAGGEIATRHREARILLDREHEIRHGLIEPPSEEMRRTHYG